jgi:peptidoglycan/LPS O-acetylase OafA/YrhL
MDNLDQKAGSRQLTEPRKEARDSNIELLRLFLALLIVAHHYAYHSGFAFGDAISFNKTVNFFFFVWGGAAISCFGIITGYYQSQGHFRIKRLISLLLEGTLISLGLYLGLYFSHHLDYLWKDLFRAFFPLFGDGFWWFYSCYILIYLFSPFFNILLRHLSQKQLQALLLIFFVSWSLVYSLTTWPFKYSDLGWLVFMYFLGAYLRLYPGKLNSSLPLQLGMFGFSLLFILVSYPLLNELGLRVNKDILGYQMMLAGPRSVFSFGLALSLFLLFRQLPSQPNRIINFLAKGSFGVYLLTDYRYARFFLWHTLVKGNDYISSPHFLGYSLLFILLVFFASLGLALVNRCLLSDPLAALISRLPFLRSLQQKITAGSQEDRGPVKIPTSPSISDTINNHAGD